MSKFSNIEDKLNKVTNKAPLTSKEDKEQKNILIYNVPIKWSEILKENGFVKNFKMSTVDNKSFIRVYLKYNNRVPVINELRRVSKPGLRRYTAAKLIKPYKNGIGMRILTTPKGILTDREAKKENVGGEVLCEIW